MFGFFIDVGGSSQTVAEAAEAALIRRPVSQRDGLRIRVPRTVSFSCAPLVSVELREQFWAMWIAIMGAHACLLACVLALVPDHADRDATAGADLAAFGADLSDALVARFASHDRMVIVTFVNAHYLDFCWNWVRLLRRSGNRHFLVGALDREAYAELRAANVPSFDMAAALTTEDFGWGSEAFKRAAAEDRYVREGAGDGLRCAPLRYRRHVPA
jgi:hypothetical protein